MREPFHKATPLQLLSEDRKRDRKEARAAVRRMQAARNFPTETDPCSRHVALMAGCLSTGCAYPMLDEDREHCAISLALTVAMLWEARAEITKLRAASGAGERTP